MKSPEEIAEELELEKYKDAPPMRKIERMALEKRFIAAFLSGVSKDDMIERFGLHYRSLYKMVTREHVRMRPKQVGRDFTGKAPPEIKIKWKHFNFQRKFIRHMNDGHIQLTNGIQGEGAHV